MTIRKTLAVTLAIAASTIAVSAAQAQTINFDNLAEGTTLSSQYSNLGVTFTPNAFTGAGTSSSGQPFATNTDMHITAAVGGDVGGLGTPSLVSGNVLHAYGNVYSGWLSENGDPSFNVNFASTISSISMDFAGVSAPADVRLFAYAGNTLLGTVAGTVTTGQFTLTFAGAGITRVAVTPGSFNDWVGVDNIRWTNSTGGGVPEPASWAMMITGFGLVGSALRRRATTVSFAA